AFTLNRVVHVVEGSAVVDFKVGIATACEGVERYRTPAGQRDRGTGANVQVGVGAVAAVYLQIVVIHDRTVEVGRGAEVGGIGAVQRDRARAGAAVQVGRVPSGRTEERAANVVQGATLNDRADERHRGAGTSGRDDAAAVIVHRGAVELQGAVIGRLDQAGVVKNSILEREGVDQQTTGGVGVDDAGRVVVENRAIVVKDAFALDGVIHVVQGYAVLEVKVCVAAAGRKGGQVHCTSAGQRNSGRNVQVGVKTVAAIHLQVLIVHDRTVKVGRGIVVSGIGAVNGHPAIQGSRVPRGRAEECPAIVVQRPAVDGYSVQAHGRARAAGGDVAAGIVDGGAGQIQGPAIGRFHQAGVIKHAVFEGQGSDEG